MNPEDALSIEEALGRIAARENLTRDQARAAMALLLENGATPAQIGALLIGLRLKGETEEEVVGLVEAMREASVKIRPRRDRVIDLCGTGGDCSGTFNISTAASFVAAGAGAAVAKHGNRSASSQCGSADVLEAMGVPIDLPPDRVQRSIEEHGMGFLFAPRYHAATRSVAGVRRELKIRTIFNLLGPLTNPAGVRRQLIGVFDPSVLVLLARVLREVGSETVWVVHAHDHLDELSIGGPNTVVVLEEGEIRDVCLRPEDCGLSSAPVEALRGGDASTNASILEKILDGEKGPPRDAVVFNAAGALVVAGMAGDLKEGAERAAESLDSGGARNVLDALRRFR